ncbi:MAG: hypothetical protein ACI81P_001168 [Neolewinella sp.]|jgi:hypothetical protein
MIDHLQQIIMVPREGPEKCLYTSRIVALQLFTFFVKAWLKDFYGLFLLFWLVNSCWSGAFLWFDINELGFKCKVLKSNEGNLEVERF